MTNIHSLSILPKQASINSVASFSDEFSKKDFNYPTLLEKMGVVIAKNNFMKEQDNSNWVSTRGSDYLYNPKLFAYAPLTHVCAFLGEAFKAVDTDRVKKSCPANVLQHALTRLKDFKK